VLPGTVGHVTRDQDEDAAVAEMKARFPESFGTMSKEDGEELMRIIDAEFGKVDPRDWE